MYDIDAFTPVITLPQTAVLGVGRIVARPVVVDDAVVVRRMLALSLTFDHADQGTVGLRLYTDEQHWTEIAFDRTKQEFFIDRTHAGVDVTPDFPVKTVTTMHKERPYDLRLIVDRSSVEAFAQNGTIAMTNLIFPTTTHNRLVFFSSTNGKVAVKGDAWTLRSIWK